MSTSPTSLRIDDESATDHRSYDLVVYGATGVAGRIICNHIAEYGPRGLRWSVCGRRSEPLQAMIEELKQAPCPPLGFQLGPSSPSPRRPRKSASNCDLCDEKLQEAQLCEQIAISTHLVLAAAGPFSVAGVAILKACAHNGTHYVDITGEVVPYVRNSVDAYHELARTTGAKLVHCAGYDSIPSDLLSLLAIDALQRECGQAAASCTVGYDMLRTAGTMSSGTLFSILEIVAHLQSHPADVSDALDPYSLCRPRVDHSLSRRLWLAATGGDAWLLPGYSTVLGVWHFAFGMAPCNTRIVRRSRSLLADAPASFSYTEVMSCGSSILGALLALLATAVFAVGVCVFALPPVRKAVEALLPPGVGPSKRMQERGCWRAAVGAVGVAGAKVVGEAVAIGQDPGYASTAMMAAQTALSLLEVSAAEKEGRPLSPALFKGGGVLTPASACGTLLVERFARHGVTFKVHALDQRRWNVRTCAMSTDPTAHRLLWQVHVATAGRPATAKASTAAVAWVPTRQPPGYALNLVNRVVHLPVVQPLLVGCYWAIHSFAAAFLSPLCLAQGVANAFVEAAGTQPPVEGREHLAIVISGCDTGFGRALAECLSRSGFTVFAGCLDVTATPLAARENLRKLAMDVTDDAQVAGAAAQVASWVDTEPGRRILCLVNNAGIGSGGFVDWCTMEQFQRDAEVNYFGTIRVCKSFLHLLQRSARVTPGGPPPRILIVSSMAGKLPVPLLASYTATKHAVAAFASCLRMELQMWGVHVCTVLPSFHLTPLVKGGVPSVVRTWEALPKHVQDNYGEQCMQSVVLVGEQLLTDWAWDAARVTESLTGAATSMHAPPRELTIGMDAHFGLHLLRRLPTAVYETIISGWCLWDLVKPRGAV